MAARGKIDHKGLAALGAERLSEILFELSENNLAIKRRLKMELFSAGGADEVAKEIRKQLATIGKSRSFVDWDKIRGLRDDLDAQRRAISAHVAPKDSSLASDLLWQFLGIANSVYERCDDSNGTISIVFHQALNELCHAVRTAKPTSADLAEKVFSGLCANDYGQYDQLIVLMTEPLGREGLLLLKTRFETLAANPPQRKKKEERRVIGWSSGGEIYEDEIEIFSHKNLVQSALTDIADALGDVDGYIARYSTNEQTNPAIAARIGERLLGAGRIEEAMKALLKAEKQRSQGGSWPDWARVYINVLDAQGKTAQAQQERWSLFETRLNAEYLKEYLKKLPDFDDEEAELKALAHAASFKDFHSGLYFLVKWPSVDWAAKIILDRYAELNGDLYDLLSAAADLAETKHPLAATLALRAMIDFSLEKARAKRYPHAIRHLESCADLAKRITDFGLHPDHEAYVAALKARHGRKSGFWKP